MVSGAQNVSASDHRVSASVHRVSAAVFANSVRRVIDTGEPSKSEDHLFIHGVEFWNSTVLQPLRNADGRIMASRPSS